MVDTLLDVDRLSVERGGRLVIADLSLTLAPGQTVLVTGRNGAGKSTLLRTLAGLLPAHAGRVTYGLADEETRGVETVHYLGYEDALKPTLTVEENLGFWAAMLSMPRRPPSPLAGEGARRADEGSGHRSTFPMPSSLPASSDPSSGASRHLLPQGEKGMSGATVDTCDKPVPDVLAAFGIGRLAALPAAYLSAGQKRRVSLARLLLAHRPIWLLDEPLIALDTAAQATLTDLMKAHAAAGGAILVASHQPLAMPHHTLDLANPAAHAERAAVPHVTFETST